MAAHLVQPMEISRDNYDNIFGRSDEKIDTYISFI